MLTLSVVEIDWLVNYCLGCHLQYQAKINFNYTSSKRLGQDWLWANGHIPLGHYPAKIIGTYQVLTHPGDPAHFKRLI